jgi:hypothetical protein
MTKQQTLNSDEASVFVRQRQIGLGAWRSAAPLLVAGIAIFYITMWFAAPILVNPFAVIDRLQEQSINLTTLHTMAMILPAVVSFLCLVLLGFIAHMYRAARIEREYQALLRARETDESNAA